LIGMQILVSSKPSNIWFYAARSDGQQDQSHDCESGSCIGIFEFRNGF
jgi:hypothetical protein